MDSLVSKAFFYYNITITALCANFVGRFPEKNEKPLEFASIILLELLLLYDYFFK